ncbi:MAG: prepilin-type N-terminal cleavage/methylation domain-containing protein [Candidatus Sungiibacteriota bacterium]
MFTNLRKRAGGKGFTLIELLVVIAIIGVLASIVLASLNSARKKSRDARRIADVKQIQLALELSFDSSNAYPDALSTLAPTYIPAVPNDPLGTQATPIPYKYCKVSATSYHLGAALEESSNPALNNDRDQTSDGCASGTFSGVDTANCAGVTTGFCYDVQP